MSNNPNQDDSSRQGTPPIAEEGVTSEELSQALALIKARKEAEAQQASETAPIESDASEAVALTHCPSCSRKLLTQASALCNWCGAKISDPKYQEQAALSRQSLDQQERKQVEEVVLEEARYGIFGRLKRRAKQNPGTRNPLG